VYPAFETEWAVFAEVLARRVGKLDKALHGQHSRLKSHQLGIAWQAKSLLRDRLTLGEDGRRWIQVSDLFELAPEKCALGKLIKLMQAAREAGLLPHTEFEVRVHALLWAGLDRHGRDVSLHNYFKSWDALEWLKANTSALTGYKTFDALVSDAGATRGLLSKWVCISANPLDMLLASEFCSYTSCFSLSGGRSQTILSYMITTFTGMAYITAEPNFDAHKHGRSWFFHDDPDHFVLGRRYGEITHVMEMLAHWLKPEQPVELKPSYPVNWINNAETNQDHYRFNAWVDTADIGFITWDPERGEKFRSLTFPSALCVGCGETTISSVYGSSWFCTGCQAGKWLCIGSCGNVFDENPENPAQRRCEPCNEEARAREAEREARMARHRAEQEANLVQQLRRTGSYTNWENNSWYWTATGGSTGTGTSTGYINVTYNTYGTTATTVTVTNSTCTPVRDAGTQA